MAIHDGNITFLNTKNVYSFFIYNNDTTSNMNYIRNNWIDNTKPLFQMIINKSIAMWLSSKGEFCYRTAPYSDIHTIPLRNANVVLTKLLGREVQIITKFKPIRTQKTSLRNSPPIATPMLQLLNYTDHSPITIHIKELLLIDKDVFNPLEPKEFFNLSIDPLIYYKNTFSPSYYLQLQFLSDHKWSYSITLQYIFYLANYNRERFHFIMSWLAAFFKNLNNRSKTLLVFLGNQESGKEILFDEIIKPLFGQEYCLNINDSILENTSVQKLLKNKLIYNINNISSAIIKEKKIKKILNDLLSKDTIEVIEDKESIREYQKFGQTIITIDEPRLPSYADKYFLSYSLFKLPDECSLVENFNLQKKLSEISNSHNNSNIKRFEDYLSNLHLTSKAKIIAAIRGDLKNFALILKGYQVDLTILNTPFKNDDKMYLQNNIEDKLQAFHKAIINYKNSMHYFQKIQEKDNLLYKELSSDFELNRIKQKNLIKYFSILCPEENMIPSRTLMVQLRKIDNIFYSSENFKIGTAGIKYFKIHQ